MAELTAALATALALVCDIPGVVDVNAGNVHSNQEVVVTVVDDAAVEEVRRRSPYLRTTHLFGVGSFTGDTLATRWAKFSMSLPGASTDGTAMQQWSDGLLMAVLDREKEAWAAMSATEQNQAVAETIAERQRRGATDFGNCWSGSGSVSAFED